MYVTLGAAKPIPRVTTETPGPVRPFPLERVLDPKTSEFGAVCRVLTTTRRGHSIGSGVLITPRHVLTCAHVIQPPEDSTNVMSITVSIAPNGPAEARKTIKADGWAVRLGWSAVCCRSYDEDYGIIRLAKPVTTPHWPIVAFDPSRLAGTPAYLAGYPAMANNPDTSFMYRSRGLIRGSMSIDWCAGPQLRWQHWNSIDDRTRLVWHLLDTRRSMSGGPMWSFVDNRRVVWGMHAGVIHKEKGDMKAILFNKTVREQIARWVSKELPAR